MLNFFLIIRLKRMMIRINVQVIFLSLVEANSLFSYKS